MFSLICAWTNAAENNGDAGDLRRHRSHYDATAMYVQADIFKTMAVLAAAVAELTDCSPKYMRVTLE